MNETAKARRSSVEPTRHDDADVRLSGPARDARLFESILHSLSDGVAVVDLDGKLLFFNDAARRMIGIGGADAARGPWPSNYGCYLPDRATPFPGDELPLSRALRGERVRDVEIFLKNPAAPRGAWISVNASPLRDERGRTVGGVAIFRDVTARRRAYEVVRRLSEAVERTADSVFITDVQGRIEYVNPAFERTTGYRRDEVLGRKPNILKSGMHRPGYYERLWATILAGSVHTGTIVNRKKNGELYDAEQTITPIKDASGNLTHFVSVVKDVTALKQAEEREVELRLARVVQQKLYPSEAPRIPGFDLAGAAYPANVTCGDYFDFIPMAGEGIAVAIGDVSGHGFPSALYMAETRAYLRSLARTTEDVGEILRRVNVFLGADTEAERFVTLLLLRLDPRQRRFVYASAGHPPGYLVGADGAVRRELGATGRPLGLFSGEAFPTSEEIDLEEGDLILLLTDGITETNDTEEYFFGAERALDVLRGQRRSNARRIVEELHCAARMFAGPSPQLDDITAVVCKVGTAG